MAEVREHACWLWSRLGISLMSLTDRNVWLEEENKRLQQEKLSNCRCCWPFFGGEKTGKKP